MIIDGVAFTHTGTEVLSAEEQRAYVLRGKELYGKGLVAIHAVIIDQEVELDYTLRSSPFERIRRITGYLVGTTDRFNNAKREEERARLKHGMEP